MLINMKYRILSTNSGNIICKQEDVSQLWGNYMTILEVVEKKLFPFFRFIYAGPSFAVTQKFSDVLE